MGEITQGHILGRYELLLPIAAGGMAMVWAARVKGTRGFQKIVAVKTMLSKLTEDEQFEQMFLDEASLASQIRHPNVVEISDLGEQDGVLYLAMEWIDGVPLNQLMKTAKASGALVPIPIAVRIVMNACAGLHAAHELRDAHGQLIGLVHRDVSPQNILVTYDGVTKVVDFGVAKATAMGGGATVAGQLKGKVSYMAPEQVRGEAIDRRVDVFALGIVLYALTTAKHPFRRESEAATMYNIASDEAVVAPRKFLPDYPATLEAVLLKSLAKDAQHRYATASEFLRALDQCLPPEERANTDEDVGNYVRSLFGTRREESRAALAAALALADKQGARPLSSSDGTGNSSVSDVTDVGLSDAVLNAESTFTSVAPTSADSQAAHRRQRAWVIGAALALLVGLALLAFGSRRSAPPRPTASEPSKAAEPVLSVVPGASSAASEPQAVDPHALPLEGASAAGRVAPSSNAPRIPMLAKPTAGSAPPAASASVRAVKPAAPKWRQDPGF